MLFRSGNGAAEYLKTLQAQEPVFFSSLSMAGMDAMKEDVKAAIRMFALAD